MGKPDLFEKYQSREELDRKFLPYLLVVFMVLFCYRCNRNEIARQKENDARIEQERAWNSKHPGR